MAEDFFSANWRTHLLHSVSVGGSVQVREFGEVLDSRWKAGLRFRNNTGKPIASGQGEDPWLSCVFSPSSFLNPRFSILEQDEGKFTESIPGSFYFLQTADNQVTLVWSNGN